MMAATDFRQRTTVLFVAVMLGHIILISAQVNSRRGVPLLEEVTFGAFAEVQRGASGFTGSIHDAWTGYVGLRGVREENEQLRQQLSHLQVQIQQERARAERARQLEQLLGFKEQAPLETLAASVIGAGASPDFRTVTLDRGATDGIAENMAVLAPQGVVGRVVTPTRGASKVQLLIDRNAAAGALVERTRAQGIVVGTGDASLRMDFVAATADVTIGDVVVTSGIDGIYPKGFVIGSVAQVGEGNGIYKAIRVRPGIDFNRLEDVLVVTTPVSREEADGEQP